MNIKRIAKRLREERVKNGQNRPVAFSMQSSIPEPIATTIGRKLPHYIADQSRAEISKRAWESFSTDPLIGGAIAKLSADIAGDIVSELAESADFAPVISTMQDNLGEWALSLLVDGNLYIHVLEDDETGEIRCGVSIDHQSHRYHRDSDTFDESPDFLYYQDGRAIPITEPIVHARIKVIGRYGTPLFASGLKHIEMLGNSETHEAKRRYLASVMTTYHRFDQYATPQQMKEYLESVSPQELDDVFRNVATQQEIEAVQGDGNVDKIQFLSYLIGRIDPLSPVPLPLLSYTAAASVNRDTLTMMMRDYRANVASWREVILNEIIRPVLRVVAGILGQDVEEEIENTTIFKPAALSPHETQIVITTATQMRTSGLIPASYIAQYIATELGIPADEVDNAMIESADIIGGMI